VKLDLRIGISDLQQTSRRFRQIQSCRSAKLKRNCGKPQAQGTTSALPSDCGRTWRFGSSRKGSPGMWRAPHGTVAPPFSRSPGMGGSGNQPRTVAAGKCCRSPGWSNRPVEL